MVDERVVDGDDALIAVASGRVLLQHFQPPFVEGLVVPLGLGKEAIEARLIGRLGELAVDAGDGLILGDQEPGEILGEVAPLGLVGEEVAELVQGSCTTWGNSTIPGMSRCSAVQ